MGRETAANDRGFTLAELLVAMAVFGIVLGGTYLIFQTNRQVFLRGQTRADIQQIGRLSMDRMVRQIRMAGYNFSPDTITNRFGFPTATVLAGAGATSNFTAVATNVRVMFSTDNGAGAGFFNNGTIDNDIQERVAFYLCPDPYAALQPAGTLYQLVQGPTPITADSPGDFTPGGAFTCAGNPTVLADNVLFMRFTYFDGQGNPLTPVGWASTGSISSPNREVGFTVANMTLPAGQGALNAGLGALTPQIPACNPVGPNWDCRARIRSVGITLVVSEVTGNPQATQVGQPGGRSQNVQLTANVTLRNLLR